MDPVMEIRALWDAHGLHVLLRSLAAAIDCEAEAVEEAASSLGEGETARLLEAEVARKREFTKHCRKLADTVDDDN